MKKKKENNVDNCLYCNKSLNGDHAPGHINYCSVKCYLAHRSMRMLTDRSKQFIDSSTMIEGEDYVIDQWNGLATPRIYGQWFERMHPGRTWDEYKNEFPDKPVQCEKDKKSTTAAGGAHMKTEKYRKMFSEKFKGENNPMSKKNTTEQQRKENSPYSEEFYIKRGLPLSMRDDMIKKSNAKRKSHFSKGYWMDKGYTEEEAIKKVREIRATNGLKSYIKRYGVEEGTRRYNERIEKYAKKMSEKYHRGEYSTQPKIRGFRVSKFEREAIEYCINALGLDENLVQSCRNHQLMLEREDHTKYYYDFCYKNKIIEFQGTYWHLDPLKYAPDYYSTKMEISAADMWKRDDEKKKFAESKGYQVLCVWEREFKKNKTAMFEKCISFINDNTEKN